MSWILLFKLMKDTAPSKAEEAVPKRGKSQDDIYYTEWYMQEHEDNKPTAQQLRDFRKVHEMTNADVQIELFSSVKTPFSFNPKHAIDD